MSAPAIPLCSVLPATYGDADWRSTIETLVRVNERRGLDDPEAEAERYLREVSDRNDLRALGFCRHCGRQITLRQVGRCVYSSCGHYRAQGDLRRIERFQEQARKRMSDERRHALLELIGRSGAEIPG